MPIQPANSDVKARFVPPLRPYNRSWPITESSLDGYFSTVEPRINGVFEKEETRLIYEAEQEWLDNGGCLHRGTTASSVGPLLALTIPEGIPEKGYNLSQTFVTALIEDDVVERDIFTSTEESYSITQSSEFDQIVKNYLLILNQMRSKYYVGMLKGDEKATAYVQSYENWFSNQKKRFDPNPKIPRQEYRDLEEYLADRIVDVSGEVYAVLLPYCLDLKISKQQYEKLDAANQILYRLCALINDYFSSEWDWITHAMQNKPGLPLSSIYVTMRIHDVSLAEAKEVIKQEILRLEETLLARCKQQIEEESEEAVKIYLQNLPLIHSGLLLWSLHAPRYQTDPGHPFYPKSQDKIRTLPRKRASNKSESLEQNHPEKVLSNGNSSKRKRSKSDLEEENPRGGREFSNDRELAPWLTKYPALPEQVALEPFEYIKTLPSKNIRKAAITALDFWYRAPQRSVDIITSVIDMLHSSSLIIDDIEDNSPLRRGSAAAHMVFGTPQAINSANFLFVKCLDEVQKLSFEAVGIYADELRNLHVGQSLDLHWTFQNECPSEEDYIKMIDGKTGGLFRMASRLLRAEATQNKDLLVEDLLTLMGRFFQIRDDYQNLASADYSAAKGDLSDLDEGKYSFMIIHALKNAGNKQLQSLLRIRSQQGYLTTEQKNLAFKSLIHSRSEAYSSSVLRQLEAEIEKKLEDIESIVEKKNWTIRAIMERLRLPDPVLAYLKK